MDGVPLCCLLSYLPAPLPPTRSTAPQMSLEEANNQNGKCVEMQKSLKSQLPAGSVLPGGDREMAESDCKPSEIWRLNSSALKVCVFVKLSHLLMH